MEYDIAIIGASSAGLFAAEQLARAGKRVGVFEQHPELDPAVRTLIVTAELKRLLGTVPEEAVLHRIRTMAVASRGATTCIKLKEPDLIIERKAFAQQLAERAQAAGATIHYGCNFQGVEPARDHAAMRLRGPRGERMTVEAHTLIGADGIFSDVARAVGVKHPPAAPIIQAVVQLPDGWDPDVTQVWFDAGETRFFYWLIPESATRGVVGLVGEDWASTRTLLRRFLDRRGFQPIEYQASWVALYEPRLQVSARIGAARVLLVGDAAGQVKVTTVGGTVSGIWGAAAAVRAVLRGTSYTRELGALKRELDLHRWLRIVLDRLDNTGYDQLLRSLGAGGLRFLSRNNRDAMAGSFWMLLVRQPHLLKVGLRLLVRPPKRAYFADAIMVRESE